MKSSPRPFSRTLNSILNKKSPCKTGCGRLTSSAKGYCLKCKVKYTFTVVKPKRKAQADPEWIKRKRKWKKELTPKSIDALYDFYRQHDKTNSN